MSVAIRHLRKSYDGAVIIGDLSVTFPDGRISVLLGASGCGKTTTLRCIAGLESPDGGEIRVGDRVVFSADRRIELAPERRDIGMVFQSYAVWPHMTVFENVEVPLRARGIDRPTIRARVAKALQAVGLAELSDRSATKLSGGQQQRLALARCIVAETGIVLLDEPLSNLDARLRIQMRGELRALQRALGITMILVTHDQEEAMSVADDVYLLDKGHLIQAGPPAEVYLKPNSRFCAEFFGKADFIPVHDWNAGSFTLTSAQGVTLRATAFTPPPDTTGLLGVVRPESWVVSPQPQAGAEWFPGEVRETLFLGNRTEAVLDTPIGPLSTLVKGAMGLTKGAQVSIGRTVDFIHFIPDDAGATPS